MEILARCQHVVRHLRGDEYAERVFHLLHSRQFGVRPLHFGPQGLFPREFRGELPFVQAALDARPQHFGAERLDDEVVGSQLERPDGEVELGIARHDQDIRASRLLGPPEQLEAVDRPRHRDVRDDDVPVFSQPSGGLVPGGGGGHRMARRAQGALANVPDGSLVVHDQDRHGVFARGDRFIDV